MNTLIKLLFVSLLFISCTSNQGYTPKNLTKVSNEKVMEMANTKSFPDPSAVVYKSPKGEILSLDSLGRIQNPTDFFQVYYQNASGVITEVIVKPATAQEKEFAKKLSDAFNAN